MKTTLSLSLARPAQRAFTLVEMLVVIGIIVLVMAIALPNMRGFREGQEIDAATRQLIADLSLARARAINGRTTVGVAFISKDIFGYDLGSPYSEDEKQQVRQLQGGIYTQYALFSFRRVGDQPGRSTPRYLTPWKTLPEKTFIAEQKFVPGGSTDVTQFDPGDFPFPLATSPKLQALHCVAFNYEGRPCKADGQPLDKQDDVVIPLARGSILYTRNPDGSVDQTSLSIQEVPPGNSITAFNHVVIDWLTGRARLQRAEVQ